MRHPIVADNGEKSAPRCITRFTVGQERWDQAALGRGWESCWSCSEECAPLCADVIPAHVPEMHYPIIPGTEFNTGGERWD